MTIQDAVWQDDERVSGAVCFRGTRLPVSILFDYLEAGQSAEEFVVDFGANLEQVRTVLAWCETAVDREFGQRDLSA